MFPLSNGRLIRLNKDGTDGEIIQSRNPTMVFGTNILYDHHIKDVNPATEVSCEISTDALGRVNHEFNIFLEKSMIKFCTICETTKNQKFSSIVNCIFHCVLFGAKTCPCMFSVFNRFRLSTNRRMKFSWMTSRSARCDRFSTATSLKYAMVSNSAGRTNKPKRISVNIFETSWR